VINQKIKKNHNVNLLPVQKNKKIIQIIYNVIVLRKIIKKKEFVYATLTVMIIYVYVLNKKKIIGMFLIVTVNIILMIMKLVERYYVRIKKMLKNLLTNNVTVIIIQVMKNFVNANQRKPIIEKI